jgi:ribosomal protein S18 acetylase RimI-like enzyme
MKYNKNDMLTKMLKEAKFENISEISKIAKASFEETYSPLTKDQEKYLNNSYSEEIIEGWILNPRMIVTISEKEKIVGFSVLVLPGGKLESDEVSKRQGEVGKLYILREYKRCGIGRLFLEKMECDCKTHNIKKLYLGVYHGNVNAIAFYKVVGFKESSKPIMFTRNSRYIMNMKLYKKIKYI